MICGYEIDLIITSGPGHYFLALVFVAPLFLLFGILITSGEVDSYTKRGLVGVYLLLCLGLSGLSHWWADFIGRIGI